MADDTHFEVETPGRSITPRLFAALTLVSFYLLPCALPAQQDPVIGKGLRASVTLITFDAVGNELATGSGFVLADGRIASSAHVVSGARSVDVYDVSGARILTAAFADVIDQALDLVILPSAGGVAAGLVLAAEAPSIGDDVWVVSSPQGLGGSVTTGIVSSVRRVEGLTWVQLSAAISPGSSGGAILDRTGAVVGIVAGAIKSGQNLNFGIAAAHLRELTEVVPGRIPFPPLQGGASTSAVAPDESTIPNPPESWLGGPTWHPLFHMRGTYWAFDRSSLGRTDAGTLRGWYRWTLDPPRGDPPYDLILNHGEFDCSSGGVRRLASHWYYQGREADRDGADAAWRFVPPESAIGALASWLCDWVADAPAPRWSLVSAIGDQDSLWLDTESIRFPGGRVQAALWMQYSIPFVAPDGAKVNGSMALVQYDCPRRRARELEYLLYLDRSLVVHEVLDNPPWRPVGSIGDSQLLLVCGENHDAR